MNHQEIRTKARELLKPFCRVCPECNGVACRGEVPGMGGKGTGRAFMNNYDAIKKISLNMKVVHGVKDPDLSCQIFGETMSLPVIAAPMTGTQYNMGGKMTEPEFIRELIEGCHLANILPSLGDGETKNLLMEGIHTLNELNHKGLVFIKPWLNEELKSRMSMLNPELTPAFGTDLDGCGLVFMNKNGMGVYPKSEAEIREIKKASRMPFIIKGIMTVEDAIACYKAGADAIVVSNHGGRVLDCARGTAEVLPEIASKLKGKLTILVDGGIRDGVDVFKMLALGADAVLIGRPFVTYAFGGGRDGVALYVEKLRAELKSTMLLTGAANLQEITSEKIHSHNN